MFYKWFFWIWFFGWILTSVFVSIIRSNDYKKGWKSIVINIVTSLLAGLASWGGLFVIIADRIEPGAKWEE